MMSANECHGVRRCAEITCKMEEFARLQVRFSITGGTSSVHTVYCKRHSVRQSAALTPNDLTLFTLGWPPYCTSTCVQELFSRVGDVRRIYLQPRPGPAKEEQGRGFRVGYIVLSSSEEVTSALNLCSANEPIPCNVHGLVSLSKWCVEYAAVRTNLKNLEAGVEAQIQAYDSRKEEEGAKRKQAGEPDKEGWITVTRRRPQTQVNYTTTPGSLIDASQSHVDECPSNVVPYPTCRSLIRSARGARRKNC